MVDPWVASKAYSDGWIPPIYTKDLNVLINAFQKIDFILVTHIHEDHFDKEFLRLYHNSMQQKNKHYFVQQSMICLIALYPCIDFQQSMHVH